MPKSVLRLEDITMQFGGVVAVDNLSIEVNDKEIVSIIGPNGAGKTTAFNVITGVYEPTNGAVYMMDKKIIENNPKTSVKGNYKGQNAGKYTSVLAPTPDRVTKLGMARTFQNIRLWKSKTVFENVLTAKHMRRKSNLFTAAFRLNRKEERQMWEDSDRLLDLLGLLDMRDEISSNLPYGKQRRLEIARAMATEPQLLILDEPAAGMNPQESKDLADFISQIRTDFGLTILLIEHHMDLVMAISDRVYVMDFGKQIAHGTPAEVQNNPAVIAAYLGVEEDEDA